MKFLDRLNELCKGFLTGIFDKYISITIVFCMLAIAIVIGWAFIRVYGG
jgi:hypothetical protein